MQLALAAIAKLRRAPPSVAALALAAARLIAVDLRRFSPDQRILTFALAGIALLAVSFVYARRDPIR